MRVFGETQPEITPVYRVKAHGFVKSGIIFSIKNGRNQLQKKWLDEDEWASQGVLFLKETPLAQFDGSFSSTTPYLLAEGYGIEKADCEELKAIDAAINAPFTDIDHSFEAVKPLLGLLADGCYLLADAEITPTDGEGRFFWDIPPRFSRYQCTAADYYLGNVRECDIFGVESVDPVYLYPSQSAALFNQARADYYTELFRTEKEPPRAIAYNFMHGMNILLDGHHKAAAAAKLGIPLKCLLIIKGVPRCLHKDGRNQETLRFTDDIIFTGEETEGSLEDMIGKQEKLLDDLPKTSGFADIMYRKRQWEEEYLINAKNYPSAEDQVLEKHFALHRRYDEIAEYLNENISGQADLKQYFLDDRFGHCCKHEPRDAGVYTVLSLMLRKAARLNDSRLKAAAVAAAGLDCRYDLTCDALRYLTMFQEDDEVEQLFISIASDREAYKKYGGIAAGYWKDKPADEV